VYRNVLKAFSVVILRSFEDFRLGLIFFARAAHNKNVGHLHALKVAPVPWTETI